MGDFLDRLPGGSQSGFAAGAALLIAVVVVVVLTSGGSEQRGDESTTVAAESQGPPELPEAETQTPSSAAKPTNTQRGSKGKSDPSPADSGSAQAPQPAPDPAAAPPPPGSKNGSPVGQTPPDADPATNAEVAESVIREYLTSISQGVGYQACAQLSESGLVAMERKIAKAAPETDGAPCAQSILLYQGAYGKAIRNPKITKLRVNGDKATAVGPYREQAKLSKYGGTWLIDDYGDD